MTSSKTYEIHILNALNAMPGVNVDSSFIERNDWVIGDMWMDGLSPSVAADELRHKAIAASDTLSPELVAEITEAARCQIEDMDPSDLDPCAQWLSDWDGWVVEGWPELGQDVNPVAHDEACRLAEKVARQRVCELVADG